MNEIDIDRGDRVLHAYDSGTGGPGEPLAVLWHHGTPNIGLPPEPLFAEADRLGIRWVGYDRPGYGGSIAAPGRSVADSAGDAAAVADAFGIDRFAVMSHSGGGPHALACAALLADRVMAAVIGSSLAPFDAEGLDYFDGMAPAGVGSLGAAARGRAARAAYEESAGEQDAGFTDDDLAALRGDWSWFLKVVGPALADGPGGMIDDDVMHVAPWGFDPAEVTVPTLVLHGDADRMVPAAHGRWLADHIGPAERWPGPGDGHLSVLKQAPAALEWLRRQAR